MMLLSVEAALLVEKGFCELFELSKLNEDLSEEQKQQIKEADEKYTVFNIV